mmetsp:Transcript_46421/g.129157  ORF Transcript_46421/g.129157 Transcript_46421/m.129157 type:complete len:257 (-) Transcript_46421:416-1186(-)
MDSSGMQTETIRKTTMIGGTGQAGRGKTRKRTARVLGRKPLAKARKGPPTPTARQRATVGVERGGKNREARRTGVDEEAGTKQAGKAQAIRTPATVGERRRKNKKTRSGMLIGRSARGTRPHVEDREKAARARATGRRRSVRSRMSSSALSANCSLRQVDADLATGANSPTQAPTRRTRRPTPSHRTRYRKKRPTSSDHRLSARRRQATRPPRRRRQTMRRALKLSRRFRQATFRARKLQQAIGPARKLRQAASRR